MSGGISRKWRPGCKPVRNRDARSSAGKLSLSAAPASVGIAAGLRTTNTCREYKGSVFGSWSMLDNLRFSSRQFAKLRAYL